MTSRSSGGGRPGPLGAERDRGEERAPSLGGAHPGDFIPRGCTCNTESHLPEDHAIGCRLGKHLHNTSHPGLGW